jgi:serine/threonine protein kinase
LILEYLPLGNLEDQRIKRPFSRNETLTILQQSLSTLKYLHGRKPPIVHRDIKPENILVQSRDPLHIKFADFGLAKASSYLKTICGTGTYLAPEIAKYCGLSKNVPQEKYTEEVDIWSLGVVILKYAYGLPHPGEGGGILWCEKIIEEANHWHTEPLVDFLVTAMLVKESKSRHSATTCLDRALELSFPSRGGSLTPTAASYTEGYEAPVFPDWRLAADPRLRSSQHEDSIPSSVIQRYVRSDAPPASSYTSISAETRKRSTRPSTSPSSSNRRRAKRHGNGSSSHLKDEESEPVIDLFGDNWLQDPNCVGSSVAAMGQEPSDWSSWDNQATETLERYIPRSIPEPVDEHNNNYDPHLIQAREAFVQDAYLVDNVAQGGEYRAWTDSEGYVAARVLQAIREGERL